MWARNFLQTGGPWNEVKTKPSDQRIMGNIVTAILNAHGRRENYLCVLIPFIPSIEMIKAILVFNNHGKPRMSKFFTHYVSSLPSEDWDKL